MLKVKHEVQKHDDILIEFKAMWEKLGEERQLAES
jgi:hypothetical protein